MAGLERDVRGFFEGLIDEFLKDPKKHEILISKYLKNLGIEPNLESILSFIIGRLGGYIENYYLLRFHRPVTDEELEELFNLLKRRSWELKQAFINTRIER